MAANVSAQLRVCVYVQIVRNPGCLPNSQICTLRNITRYNMGIRRMKFAGGGSIQFGIDFINKEER